MTTTALVVVSGPGRLPVGDLPAADLVVAADGGLDVAATLGLAVDVAVGDFDSATPAALEAATMSGTTVERHPVSKDSTDLDLALAAATARGASRVVVVGGDGGRFDHVLGNALTLAAPHHAGLRLEARFGTARIWVVRDRVELVGRVGELVSLLAVGGPAGGVRTTGLRYPLRGEELAPGSSRGLSNEYAEPRAVVDVAVGTVLAVAPGQP